ITGMVVDIVYRPLKTAFLQAAEDHGLRVLGGLGMLVYQAAAAFELWTGATAPISVMRRAAEQELTNQGS
ncbi:MAG: Shikimate 5-dehydrogenase alpha, partial [Chloroflexi bacterium]|nr:Shikimate 5-dehydrogenase alpha [Chloroflexota bacterium]